jgi:hypothetical protein
MNKKTGFSILMMLSFTLGLFSLWHDTAEAARRMGGGKSFGSKPGYQRSAPPPSQGPTSSPTKPGQTVQPQPANTTPPAPMGRWGGMLGGLLMGGLIGSLLFGGGFSGPGLLDLLLLGGGLFLLFRFLRARRMAAASPSAGGTMSFEDDPAQAGGDTSYTPSEETAAATVQRNGSSSPSRSSLRRPSCRLRSSYCSRLSPRHSSLFIGGWLRVDVVGLLVLSALALTGLVTRKRRWPASAVPAVVTVWALFILSAGLTRTGIAHQLGQPLQRFTKGSEATLMVALMVAASLLSALINTVTVAAILLPSTMELARRSGRPPSRLLMPLALGCLLGGPFTGISTPPNILVTDALRNAGLRPFAIFRLHADHRGHCCGRYRLHGAHRASPAPHRSAGADAGTRLALGASYQLDTHIFTTRIPTGSPLDGRTLAESRLGSALYLTVLALQRKGVLILAPRPNDVLQSGDMLIVHGSPDHLQRFHASQHLQVESSDLVRNLLPQCLQMAEGIVTEGSPLLGSTLAESGLRREHRVHVVALHCPIEGEVKDLRRHQLAAGATAAAGRTGGAGKIVPPGLCHGTALRGGG